MRDEDRQPETGAPRLSIITVTYNSLSYLQGLLASITAYAPEDRYELIVVDNASTDGTAPWCLCAPLGIRLVVNHENRGFAAGSNAGAQLARGELLLFCNPDVCWISPVADRLLHFMEGKPSCGLAAARLVFPDRTFQPSCTNFPTFRNIWFSRGSALSRAVRPARGPFQYTLGDFTQPTLVEVASGTCALVRRRLFADLGGFDERFFLFVEDTDFCRRLADAGHETWLVPSATAIHHWGGSSTNRRAVARHHAQSMAEYFRKHFPRARLRNLLLRIALWAAGYWSGSTKFKTRADHVAD